MSNKKVGFILGIVCMLLTIGICIQIKTVNDSSTGVGKTKTENELRNSALKWKEKYEQIYKEADQKELELENLRTEVANQDSDSVNLRDELEEATTLLGYSEVSRTGVNYYFERC